MSDPDRRERILLLTCVGLALWECLTVPVFSQEAYYWCYAQHPDLSYFDHPPMVAWMIWLGTRLFGDDAAGIRACTFLCSIGTTWFGLAWLRHLGADAWVRRGWLVCSFAMPMLMCGHFLTTPDPPLVFWWTLSMYALWRARDGAGAWWMLAGFAAGCALLSKYAAAFLAVSGLLLVVFDPQMRRQLRRPGIYVGVLFAALTFLPVVIWNVANDFESFRFQTEGRWKHSQLGVHWLLSFLGSQIGLLHPVIALPLPLAVLWLAKRAMRGDRAVLWMLAFGLPMPLFFLFNSLFIQVKVNWLMPCFLPLAAGVMTWWRGAELHVQRPRTTRLATRLMIGTAIVTGVGAPLVLVIPQNSGSSWHGWDHIAERAEFWEEQVDGADGVEGNMFFFASGYRDAAQLSLHLTRRVRSMPDGHELEFVLAQNTYGETALQFDHWEPARRHIGQDAIYVLLRPDKRPHEKEKLAAHFESVELVEHIELTTLGITVGSADIYAAHGYRGPHIQ